MRRRTRMAVPQVIVPFECVDRATLRAIAYARTMSTDVTALALAPESEANRLGDALPATARSGVCIEHRSTRDLAAYLSERQSADPERPIAVVVSDIVPRSRWT